MIAETVARGHFGSESYAAFAIDEDAAARATEVSVIQGDVEGPVTGDTYRYLIALADGRSPIEGFMSTPSSNEVGAVALAEDDARDQLRDCSANNEDAQDMFACMDAVMAQVALECELSVGTPSCTTDCWLEVSKC